MGTRVLVPQLRTERRVRVKDIARVLEITVQGASPYARGERLPSDPQKFVGMLTLLGLGRNSTFGELFPDLPEVSDNGDLQP